MKVTLLLTILVIYQVSFAQSYIDVRGKKYFLGCKLDDRNYSKIPESQQIRTRGIETYAASYTLESYLPVVGDQGMTGTCTAWATSFYTLSILYNKSLTDKKGKIDFSPFFLYNNLKLSSDSACDDGMYIEDALNFLKYKGGLPKKYYTDECSSNKTKQRELWDVALNYRIKDFKRIGEDNRIQRIKRALSLKKAIVIAIKTPMSFASSLNGDTWDGIFDFSHGGHALSLIGYDDNKEGGSFLIINSWGQDWGDNGKIWVKYSDFDKLVYQVFEVTGYSDSEIKRYATRNNYEGEIKIFDKKGKEIEQKFEDIDLLELELDTTDSIDDDFIGPDRSKNEGSRRNISTNKRFKADTIVLPELDSLIDISEPELKIVPEILEYEFEYYSKNDDCENGFKIKITNQDSGYIYLFSVDEYENTVTPILKNNNTQIFLGKKRPDIILPETEYIKECDDKKFILLISKEMISESKIENICDRKYNYARDFINYNFSDDLVVSTPTKDEIGNGFSLKNDPGKILPIIIKLNSK